MWIYQLDVDWYKYEESLALCIWKWNQIDSCEEGRNDERERELRRATVERSLNSRRHSFVFRVMPQAKLYLVHEEAQNQSNNTMIFSSRIMSHAGTNYSSLWSVLRTKQKSLYVKISVRLSSIANRQIVSVVPCSSRSVRLRRSAIVTAEWKSEGSLGRVGSFFFLPVPSLSRFFTP